MFVCGMLAKWRGEVDVKTGRSCFWCLGGDWGRVKDSYVGKTGRVEVREFEVGIGGLGIFEEVGLEVGMEGVCGCAVAGEEPIDVDSSWGAGASGSTDLIALIGVGSGDTVYCEGAASSVGSELAATICASWLGSASLALKATMSVVCSVGLSTCLTFVGSRGFLVFGAADFGRPLLAGLNLASLASCSSFDGRFNLILIFFIPDARLSTSQFLVSSFAANAPRSPTREDDSNLDEFPGTDVIAEPDGRRGADGCFLVTRVFNTSAGGLLGARVFRTVI
jgi:hypothetical protein